MYFKNYKPYIISVVLTLLFGFLGSLATRSGFPVYEQLSKPALTPPSIVFSIVWTVLFILMGIGAAIIWQSNEPNREKAITIYIIQLIANVIWSYIFFLGEAYLLSFIWLIVLWILIIVMIYNFSKINRTAALIQIPYLLWVTFAGYLNYAIWVLN